MCAQLTFYNAVQEMFKQFARRISNELTHLSSNSKSGTVDVSVLSSLILSFAMFLSLVQSQAKAIAASYFKKHDKFSSSEDLHYLNEIICNKKLK